MNKPKHELNNCGVSFIADGHKYFLGEKELQGITSTIVSWMFPSTYAGVSEQVLAKAAAHGLYVHECIEMADIVGATADCPESAEYLRMMAENEMRCISHEYLVTDGTHFASAIDLVLEDKQGEVVLADIKTTSALHKDKVRLQLSVYAYLFEKLNPNRKVKDLVEVWLPKKNYGNPQWVHIERTSNEDVERTIQAYLRGESPAEYTHLYTENSLVSESKLLAQYNTALESFCALERKANEIKAQQEEIKAALLQAFKENNVKKVENELLTITYVAPSSRVGVDSKKLKAEYTEVYNACKTETLTKDSIRIKLK